MRASRVAPPSSKKLRTSQRSRRHQPHHDPSGADDPVHVCRREPEERSAAGISRGPDHLLRPYRSEPWQRHSKPPTPRPPGCGDRWVLNGRKSSSPPVRRRRPMSSWQRQSRAFQRSSCDGSFRASHVQRPQRQHVRSAQWAACRSCTGGRGHSVRPYDWYRRQRGASGGHDARFFPDDGGGDFLGDCTCGF